MEQTPYDKWLTLKIKAERQNYKGFRRAKIDQLGRKAFAASPPKPKP